MCHRVIRKYTIAGMHFAKWFHSEWHSPVRVRGFPPLTLFALRLQDVGRRRWPAHVDPASGLVPDGPHGEQPGAGGRRHGPADSAATQTRRHNERPQKLRPHPDKTETWRHHVSTGSFYYRTSPAANASTLSPPVRGCRTANGVFRFGFCAG